MMGSQSPLISDGENLTDCSMYTLQRRDKQQLTIQKLKAASITGPTITAIPFMHPAFFADTFKRWRRREGLVELGTRFLLF
jgi:hypothetical protein